MNLNPDIVGAFVRGCSPASEIFGSSVVRLLPRSYNLRGIFLAREPDNRKRLNTRRVVGDSLNGVVSFCLSGQIAVEQIALLARQSGNGINGEKQRATPPFRESNQAAGRKCLARGCERLERDAADGSSVWIVWSKWVRAIQNPTALRKGRDITEQAGYKHGGLGVLCLRGSNTPNKYKTRRRIRAQALRAEPGNKMGYYRDTYLKSEDWKSLRAAKLAVSQSFCCICHTRIVSADVHHIKYRNLYDVTLHDLKEHQAGRDKLVLVFLQRATPAEIQQHSIWQAFAITPPIATPL